MHQRSEFENGVFGAVSDSGENRNGYSVGDDAREWVERVLGHGAGAEEEAAMLEWSNRSPEHARALADAVYLRGRLTKAYEGIRTDPEAAAMLAEARAPVEQPRSAPWIGRRAFLTGAVAASAAGVMAVRPPLGLWPSLSELNADYRTGTGERRTVKVASDLALELNTRTALSRDHDDRAYRFHLISGEVAVDAGRLARPAVIQTAFGDATISNGQFSARLDDNSVCVTCFAGDVAVRGRHGFFATLGNGQQTSIGTEVNSRVVAVDADVASGWRRGVLIFNDRPLSEVVREINRYRAGRLILTNSRLASHTVNAIFRLDRLEVAPEQMKIVAGAEVTSLPGGIVLLS